MKNANATVDFESSIGPWLGRTVKVVDYYLHEAFKAGGIDLTKEQMSILKTLHQQDGLQQNELACLTYRDKSSLARILATLESKQYIIRKHCKEDKRINKVFLTEKGEDIFYRTRPILKETIDKMEKNIEKGEIKNIIKTLQKIQSNLLDQVK